jgi:hypothetical protein
MAMKIDDVPIETSNAMFDYRRAMVDVVYLILCIVYVMKEICPVRHPKLCALKKIDPASAGRVLGNELNTQNILGLSGLIMLLTS